MLHALLLGALFAQLSAVRPVFAMRSSMQLQAAAYSWARQHCEKNLWMTMDTCLHELDDNTTYVITGDINAMWTRDSTAQLWPYLRMLENSVDDTQEGRSEEETQTLQHLEQLLAGALRRQAKFLLTDPYANSYTDTWNSALDARLCRGGYVFTGNFEVDSGVYFMRLFSRLAALELKQRGPPKARMSQKGKSFLQESEAGNPHSAAYSILGDPTVRKAVTMLVALYRQERDHALGKSKHRYPLSAPWELPGKDGTGNLAKYTGMVWGAFRPSDDPQMYAYNIPNNMFLASQLKPVSELAQEHWEGSEKLVGAMQDLRTTILEGVHKYGTTDAAKAGLNDTGDAEGKVYCYETDGLGNCLLMDDANVPSLLSLPYLDPSRSVFDEQTYSRTRKFILSKHNPWFFQGKDGAGVGSPHTGEDNIWPLALVVQAMTSTEQSEKDAMLANLMKVQSKSSAKNGLSESFNKDQASMITRTWFAWPNAMLAEYLMGQHPSGCAPSLAELKAHLPKQTLKAKRAGPLEELGAEFYLAPEARLRRSNVVLPAEEYYPL